MDITININADVISIIGAVVAFLSMIISWRQAHIAKKSLKMETAIFNDRKPNFTFDSIVDSYCINDKNEDNASHTSQITPILNLSDFDRFELTAKINSLLAYDTNRVKEATDDIKASLKCVKRIRKKMERSSIENYDGYLQMKSDLNEQKSKCTQQLLEVDKELQELRAQKAISASKLAKAKSDYEALLKKQSINDISARALLAFDELQASGQ